MALQPHAPAPRRVILTRPQREAERWVAQLGACGVAAQALPLIDIRPVAEPALHAALQAARARWSEWHAVMFVSVNAAQYFFEQNPALTLVHQAQTAIKTRFWAPGPGTAAALCQLGLPAHCVDQPRHGAAQFDSESLWQEVAGQITPGARVLIVRGTSTPQAPGGSGREWLAERIAAAGGQVEFVAAYERCAPTLDRAQQALARAAAHDGSLWLLSSSEAVAHLCTALPEQSWARARALATHPRIAAAARGAGFGQVQPCRPALQDVLASIESWHDQ